MTDIAALAVVIPARVDVVADVSVYVRQSHAERDPAALGRLVRSDE